MKKWSVMALILLFSIYMHSANEDGSVQAQGKFVPPDGKVLFISGQGQGTNEALDYIRATGRVPAGFMLYTSVQDTSGLDKPGVEYSGANYGKFFVDRYSNTTLQIGLWMSGATREIVEGVYDENIDFLSKWIKASGLPVYLRIGYEFDWQDLNYDPVEYTNAYRYIVDRMRKKGVSNVAFVWHSFGKVREIPLSAWYPGDDYVDWCGLTYFAQGAVEMKRMVNFAKQKGKPVMLAETTPYGIGVLDGEKSWKAWFAPLFKFIRANGVKALCYINADWDKVPQFRGQGWGNSRVQDNAFVLEQWQKEMDSGSFLFSSPELYQQLGFRPDEGLKK